MMKNKFIVILIVIVLSTFSSCKNYNSSKKNSSIENSNQTVSSESGMTSIKYEQLDIYGSLNGNDEFSKVIFQNNIDINYNKEFYVVATTSEMADVQSKYIDIWKNEMNYSIDNYFKMLDANDTKLFNNVQKQWEDSTISNLKLESSILSTSGKYDVILGSSFQYQWLSEVRESYRQRTIRIKYLNYLLETQISNPKPLKDCLSIWFKNN